MGERAEGRSEEFFVDGGDGGVVMRFAQGLAFVFGVDGGDAGLANCVSGDARLSPSPNAATGAGHHFDEVVFGFAGADLFNELTGFPKGVHHGDLCGNAFEEAPFGHRAFDGDLGFFNSLQTGDGRDVQVVERQFAPGDEFVGGAQRGFHHPAGIGEDVGGAGAEAERCIHFRIFQGLEVDAGLGDHFAKLAGGEHNVNVLRTAGIHFGTRGLELFGGAGHNGNHEHFLGFLAKLLGIVGFDHGAHHLLRRFAGGEIGEHVGVVIFHEGDPAGRATGKHGQGDVFLIDQGALEAGEQLGALFHDGEIGGKVGVEDGIESHAAQRGGHLSGNQCAGLHAEAFAEGGADGGCGLDNDGEIGVVERGPHFVDLVTFGDGTDGADGGTLAALHAGDGVEPLPEGGADGGFKAAALREERGDPLDFGADGDAAAAGDALGAVADEAGGAVVLVALRLFAFIAEFGYAEIMGDTLQFTVFVAVADLAVALVLGEEQLDNHLAGFAHAAVVGMDLHLLGNGHHAGGHQILDAFNLDQTDAACADGLDFFEIAKRWDGNTGLSAGFEYGGSFVNPEGGIVDG